MYKDSKKHPILEIISPSEYDALITEVYQSIRNRPICWLATEQLEYLFNGYKIHDRLWFHSVNNTIEFFNDHTDQLLAQVKFDQQLIQLPRPEVQILSEMIL